MTRRGVLGALSLSFGGLLSGCSSLLGTTGRLRYRITITCNTPDGAKSGSAVQEIMRYDPIDAIKPINLGTTEMIGDAVVLTVAGIHYFVGLRLCDSLVDDAIRIGKVDPPSAKVAGNNAEHLKAFAQADGRAIMDGVYRASLPSRNFGFSTFDDVSKFETAKTFDFGTEHPSWTLEAVLVEATAAPITRQANQILPWLSMISEDQLRQSSPDNGELEKQISDLSDRFGGKS